MDLINNLYYYEDKMSTEQNLLSEQILTKREQDGKYV